MNRSIYLYVLDTLADWEPGHVLAELNTGRYFRRGAPDYSLTLVGATAGSVHSLGGLRYTPDIVATDCHPVEGDLLLLPGGDTWLEPAQAAIIDVAARCLDEGVLVAAICGATTGLANAGLFDNRTHTSNALEVLQYGCPNYAGADYYSNEKAVTAGNLVTATGTSPVEFAREVFKALDVFKPETLAAWYGLHADNDPQQFFALMSSIDKDD